VLYPVLKQGFDAFEETVAVIRGRPVPDSLTITTTPAFAAFRLLPVLPQLEQIAPGTAIRIHATEELVDLQPGAADIAIRFGVGPYTGHEALEVGKGRMQPVASPLLQLRAADELARHRLVHFQWKNPDPALPTWNTWLHAAHRHHPDADGGLVFSDEAHAIQAVIAGQGVGLLGVSVVRDAVNSGILHLPFGPALPSPGYWLLRRAMGTRPAYADALWEMLIAILAETPGESDAEQDISPPA
jgi:LysR family transcriptional regulator, glycine cleavage system transcriptional activator